jgi:cytochrome b
MKILVWDIPTRLFHWLFAGSFVVAYLAGDEHALLPLHVFAGLLILVLIAFRLVWGLIGSRYARFTSFMFSPLAAMRYAFEMVRGKARHFIGHNPAGSWAIYALLLLGAASSITGLMTLLSGESFKDIHEVLANAMLVLVIAHIIGVVVGSVLHKEHLAKSMVNGYKEGNKEDGIRSPRYLGAVILLALAAGAGGIFLNGYDAAQRTLKLPFISQPLNLAHEEHGGHGNDAD